MRTASQVRNHPVIQTTGRVGMVFYGGVHVLIAWLALQVVIGQTGEQADSKGAIAEIAETGAGPVLLWALTIGLFLFALWQFAEGVAGHTHESRPRKRLAKRIGSGARGITAVGIGLGALDFARGAGSTNSTGKQQELTAEVLAMPFGQVLVGAVALAVLVLAAVLVRKGVTRSFEHDLDLSELPTGSRGFVQHIGRAGYIGKGLAYGVIGVLVGLAAVHADPERSGGMDKALHTVAAQPYGVVLLAAIALGLGAFGVYCFAAAKAHR
ncbi:DUF1206 domain-containing protein [Actinokineospora diospyrosa]|uniref:DUF1206 domain-containing protein n=1 Tax=Actinokineospora diospyrosa TaxID=103728 RepID=A0ABT1IGZ6_9PSEU|nr:DUF1206 domain-containing protein [Actinokineospora diospyrosa]MCP2271546.1 protein of unknown function (DUF1206) [Actinokineospora diospyrosa]